MSRRPRVSRAQIAGVAAICAAAAFGVAASGAAPTGVAWIDVMWCLALGAAVALAGSKARRWSLFVLTGVAGLLGNGVSLIVAAVALTVLVIATVMDRRSRYIGAAIGGLAIIALCWTEPTGPTGLNSVLGAVAVTCVLVSGYRTTHRRARRVLRRIVTTTSIVLGAATVIGGLALLAARPGLENGVRSAEEGLAAARDGDIPVARSEFEQAQETLQSRADLLGAWWVAPSRLVPVVSQHVATLETLARSGADVAGAANEVALAANADQLEVVDGRIDLAAVEAAQGPLDQALEAVTSAVDRLETVRSPWLAWVVNDRIDSIDETLEDAAGSTETAALAARNAPAMLGADGTRRYLLLFTTPAESRGLGGFVGNWGIVDATDGALELVDTGRTTDLADADGALERTLTAPEDYVARYGNRYTPAVNVMNVTASPDFPTVGAVAADVFGQAGLGEIDGVVALDPAAVAGLLSLTGPVQIPGVPEPLDADALERFLLVDQYAIFPDRDQREEVLDQLLRDTFDAFLTTARPGPSAVADAFGPAVAGGRLLMWTPDPAEQQLLARLGLDGVFPRPADAADLLSVRTANANANKMDVYLQREIDHRATIDPGSGELRATTSVTLVNDTPYGLPSFVLGNTDGVLPLGANRQWITLYTPHSLSQLRVDGVPVPSESLVELGWNVYSTLVVVPPSSSVEVSFDLLGTADPHDYELLWWSQPTSVPDLLRVDVRSGDDELISFDGDGSAVKLFRPTQD